MVQVRSAEDLDRVAREARARHDRLMAQRRTQLVETIGAALDRGASDLNAILETLSDRDRNDLVDAFPQLLSGLTRAQSAEELRSVIAGGRALLRTVEGSAPSRDAALQKLSRVALATASVDPARRPVLTERLREIDEAETPRRLSLIWLRYRLRSAAAALRALFALKPRS